MGVEKDPISWFPPCSGESFINELIKEALFPGHFAFLLFVLLSGFFWPLNFKSRQVRYN